MPLQAQYSRSACNSNTKSILFFPQRAWLSVCWRRWLEARARAGIIMQSVYREKSRQNYSVYTDLPPNITDLARETGQTTILEGNTIEYLWWAPVLWETIVYDHCQITASWRVIKQAQNTAETTKTFHLTEVDLELCNTLPLKYKVFLPNEMGWSFLCKKLCHVASSRCNITAQLYPGHWSESCCHSVTHKGQRRILLCSEKYTSLPLDYIKYY